MEFENPQKKRAFFDRRSGLDRRDAYSLDYFLDGGGERRTTVVGERRHKSEDRRKTWIKISRWSSLYVEGKKFKAANNEDPLDRA